MPSSIEVRGVPRKARKSNRKTTRAAGVRRLKPVAMPLDTRSLTVLGGLALSMILVSALLLLLEPSPQALVGAPMTLSIPERTPSAAERAILEVCRVAEPGRWDGIVIHHSGQTFGSAVDLAREHQRYGYGGLGHHFVIGNGDGEGDGEILVGYRWGRQMDGRHVPGRGQIATWYNEHTIGVCLIGDGNVRAPSRAQIRQLILLVRTLKRELGLRDDQVYLMSDLAERSQSPGRLFPTEAFRRGIAGAR